MRNTHMSELHRGPLVALILVGTLSLFLQSYLAAPRSGVAVLLDLSELILLVLLTLLAVAVPKHRTLSLLALLSLLLAAAAFLDYVRPHYASLFLLLGIWFASDAAASRVGVKPLILDLLARRSRYLLPVSVASLGIGMMVELANAPSRLWVYLEPFPSLLVTSVPLLPSLLGWALWTVCLTSFIRLLAGKR